MTPKPLTPPGDAPDPDEAVRARIRELIAERELAQTRVAMAAGLSWPQWQRRMSAPPTKSRRSRWTYDELRRVAAALGVDVNELTESEVAE